MCRAAGSRRIDRQAGDEMVHRAGERINGNAGGSRPRDSVWGRAQRQVICSAAGPRAIIRIVIWARLRFMLIFPIRISRIVSRALSFRSKF